MIKSDSVSVVIPTYRRESVLLDTVRHLLALDDTALEIIVVDQSPGHELSTSNTLGDWEQQGTVRWLRLPRPSIPHAMNAGLLAARGDLVLFVDDDILPDAALVAAHIQAHREQRVALVAGQVIQPWEKHLDAVARKDLRFASDEPGWRDQFMGGNFSIRRDVALRIGGFDENFHRVAYRFEAEFAARLLAAGERIYYDPRATLEHLKIAAGGTRSYGNHLTTILPGHAVGEHYFFWRTRSPGYALLSSMKRLFNSIRTRHHLRRPWFIPLTLVAECSGWLWATGLFLRGPRYLHTTVKRAPHV